MTHNPFLPQPPGTTNPFRRQQASASGTTIPMALTASAAETPSASTPVSMDDEQAAVLVQEAKTLKARMDADRERYDEIKGLLWDGIGRVAGTVPGTSAKFRPPVTTRRKVNYSVLESKFPTAYEAAVTVTTTDPSTPGALYL